MKYRNPLKSLGQNFLINQSVIENIIEAAEISESDCILEVGPGRGALTNIIAERTKKLVVVEFDHALAEMLSSKFIDNSSVEVVDADILKVNLDNLLGGYNNWKVVANLPYNISTEVLFKFLDSKNLFSRLVLMLQKEVGDRLVAKEGGSDYGVTTLLLGLWFDIKREFVVHPGCFNPPPKVDSAVLSFTPLQKARFDVGDETIYKRIVKAAFAMRRKTLNNCLKSAAIIEFDEMEQILKKCGIDGGRRGETLSMKEFALLSKMVSEKI